MPSIIRVALTSIGLSLLFVRPGVAFAKEPTPPADSHNRSTANFTFYTQEQRKWVPFIVQGGNLLLQVEVRGERVWAILDNGAASSAIDTGFVEQQGIAVIRSLEPFQTVTGSVQRQLTEEIEVNVPGVVKVRSPLSAVDLSSISAIIGKPIKMILGREYFEKTAVIIAFKNNLLNMGPASAVKFTSSGAQADLPKVSLEGSAPLVSLSVNGRPVKVKLDTGFGGDLSLIPDVWDQAISDDAPTDFGGSMSLEGTARAELKAIDQSVTIAGESLESVTVRRSNASASSQDGLLGVGMLSRFDAVVINMEDRTMTLIPKSATSDN